MFTMRACMQCLASRCVYVWGVMYVHAYAHVCVQCVYVCPILHVDIRRIRAMQTVRFTMYVCMHVCVYVFFGVACGAVLCVHASHACTHVCMQCMYLYVLHACASMWYMHMCICARMLVLYGRCSYELNAGGYV